MDLRHTLAFLLATTALMLGAGPGVADASSTCTGTLEHPGVLAGVYSGGASIEGVCDVDGGPATVEGDLTVLPGSTLVAAYAKNDVSPPGESSLTVTGNLLVESGAVAILGCKIAPPSYFPCLDDGGGESQVHVEENVTAHKPLGIVMHDNFVKKSVEISGGGGGVTCDEENGGRGPGIYGILEYPTYSTVQRSTIDGNLTVTKLKSCWLGIAQNVIHGSATISKDDLREENSVEILGNEIGGNLTCKKDSNTFDDGEYPDGGLWPRMPEPNTVGGRRRGQCVLSSPTEEGGQYGPGPF